MTKRYTRRAFLATTGAAGVATVLARTGTAFGAARGAATGRGSAATVKSGMAAVASLTRSNLAPLVGSKFRMANGASTQAVVLESVADLSAGRSDGRFSMVFRGAKSTAWEQGTYLVSHRGLGTASLLVVPVDRGVRARRYQIIVNRA